MKYFVQIFVYFMLPHLPLIGTVTIDFNSIGYIEESIVLQCQGTNPIAESSVEWYRGGSLMDISSSRYIKTKTPTGSNLTISSLITADGGVYRCSIDFGTSATKSLTIYYKTMAVNITKLNPKGIEITFIAFPDPVYVVKVKQDGAHQDVYWNVTKSTQASGAIEVLLWNSTAFQDATYTVHVNITSPLHLNVKKEISWVSDQTTNSTDDCSLGLALGVGLGNAAICIICFIFIVILVKIVISRKRNNAAHQSLWHATGPNKYATAPNKGTIKLIIGLGFGIIGVTCIVCIVILVEIGEPCVLKLGLGLGLGLCIPFVGCIIAIVIVVRKGATHMRREGMLKHRRKKRVLRS